MPCLFVDPHILEDRMWRRSVRVAVYVAITRSRFRLMATDPQPFGVRYGNVGGDCDATSPQNLDARFGSTGQHGNREWTQHTGGLDLILAHRYGEEMRSRAHDLEFVAKRGLQEHNDPRTGKRFFREVGWSYFVPADPALSRDAVALEACMAVSLALDEAEEQLAIFPPLRPRRIKPLNAVDGKAA